MQIFLLKEILDISSANMKGDKAIIYDVVIDVWHVLQVT